MMSFSKEPELITPDIFEETKAVEAWFSYKNTQLFNNDQQIRGLNLGYNTAESSEIVDRHRSNLQSYLKIEKDQIAYADQVHGNKVELVSKGGTFDQTDGLITRVAGLTLAIQVADCAAVLLADPGNHIVAAVHAGWRGAVGDILPKTIESMLSLGAVAGHIKAFVSPCISQKHFEVGSEVAEQFPDLFVDYTSYKKPHVNLKGFLKSQLLQLEVQKDHIQIHEGCTVAEERYYSFRREQQRSGRMLGLIRLKV